MVEPHPPGPCDVRQDAVEHFAPGSVGIEPAIDKITQAPPGLRPTPGIPPFDRSAPPAERVHATGGIFLAVAQKPDEIPHGDMAQPQHQRFAAGIDQLVDPARLEPAGDMDMAVGRNHRLDSALIVEAGTAFDPRKAPAFGRHRYSLVIGIAPPRQTRLTRVERYRGVAAHRSAAAQRERRNAEAVGYILGSDDPG